MYGGSFLVLSVAAVLLEVGCQQPSKVNKTVIEDIFGSSDPPVIESKNMVASTPDPTACECVAHYLCGNDSTINTSGAGIIDIRADEDGPCKSYLDFCCYPQNKKPRPTPPPPKWRGCGLKNSEGVGFRITGNSDNEAQFGELPWMTAITYESIVNSNDHILDVYNCGGALIHPKVVLTAAHCVSDKSKIYKVRVGEWDTQTTKELYPHQDRYLKEIVIHSAYYAPAVFNDVALLILESPVELAPNIDFLCLPPQDYVFKGNTKCIASGWGKDEFGKKGKYQVILKRIDLPMVDRHVCQERLRTTRLGRYFELHKSFVCAGGEPGKDTCKGDGGSPLVCPIPGRDGQYQHAGIVSWGIGCGEKMIPGVYANVALFRHWIDEQMAIRKLDPETYQY